jgi:hypothetical protein
VEEWYSLGLESAWNRSITRQKKMAVEDMKKMEWNWSRF